MELLYAYIDPGSGSLVIQALIAGLVAVPVFFRRQIARFVSTLRGRDTQGDSRRAQDDPTEGA